jgi:spectinomycin phosphotransferase
MREPPKIADETLRAALRARYGIDGAELTFLPLGNDSASAAYRVDAAGGATCFLKLRASVEFSASSLAVPRHLHDQGVPQIVAPLPASGGALWCDLGDFVLSLHPFIDGGAAADLGLSEQQWRALGSTLRQIHTSQLPADLLPAVRSEPFAPQRGGRIAEVEAALSSQAGADPLVRELSACWQAHRAAIHTLAERVDLLGRELPRTAAAPVLCHADLHTSNVLVDSAGRLWLVDWDYTRLALKERDLLFLVGGVGSELPEPQEIAWFLQGYGDTPIDQTALAYERASMAVQNLIEYGTRVRMASRFDEQIRRGFVDGFAAMFAPRGIVELSFEGLGMSFS